MERTLRFFHALSVVALITVTAALVRRYLPRMSWFESATASGLYLQTDFLFFLALTLLAALGLMIYSRGRFWRVGLAAPIGKTWWFLLPVVIVAALAGGVVVPWEELGTLNVALQIVYAVIVIPLATELLFRGLAHGILAAGSRVQSCANRWFFSFPSVAAAIIYAFFPVFLMLWHDLIPRPGQIATVVQTIFAALALGLMAGLIRERSHSLFPGILFQAVAMLILIFLTGALT
ncbi:MAG: hypothetical protein JJV98_05060 [Desulfosarcina sp.]|nr:hypothetical protein [Desulfobacterales bacterium]